MARQVAAIVYDGFLLLDLAGPLGALEVAGNYVSDAYAVELISVSGGMVRSSSGVSVETVPFPAKASIDLLLVPGGPGTGQAVASDDLVTLIRRMSSGARRCASICSGAFLLAAAGLLTGRRATTHWGEAQRLRRNYPETMVDADCIFVEDGAIWTSAGITAGIDLALALIEKDHGFTVAKRVAQSLVVDHRRRGGQQQFSALLELQGPDGRFGVLLEWVRERLHERMDVKRLAEQCCLSPRQFSRAFSRETGLSPGKAIEKMRVDCAYADVAAGNESLELIARKYGFSTAARMRRSFIKFLGFSPQNARMPMIQNTQQLSSG